MTQDNPQQELVERLTHSVWADAKQLSALPTDQLRYADQGMIRDAVSALTRASARLLEHSTAKGR